MSFERAVEMNIRLSFLKKMRMIMVVGCAVNFQGYRRHSAVVGFWTDMEEKNLAKLTQVLREFVYEQKHLPASVKNGAQNISVKILPDQELELITNFSPEKTVAQAWEKSIEAKLTGKPMPTYRVLHILMNSWKANYALHGQKTCWM